MAFLPDDLKLQTFPCPRCGHYINDEMDVCNFCSTPLTEGVKAASTATESAERKKVFLGNEKRLIWTGLAIITVALVSVLTGMFDFQLNYSSGYRPPCLSAIAFVVGLTMTLHAVRGYLREKKK